MRIANRILAVAAALVLAAAGLLVAVEIAWAALGHQPLVIPYDDWYTSARDNRWDASGPRSLFLVLAAAGLVLLALQVIRARPRSIPLDDRQTRAGISRRSLEQALARAVGAEDGIARARAKVGRRKARVVAATRRTQGDLAPRVEEATRRRLQAFGLDGALKVAVEIDKERR
ncbi:MAG: DUF6286 domain-containing protein [Actinomycetota bacterium]|jgi:hypothetical protein